jgi:tetratricopeptide (TPR) repeat protein
VSGYLDLAACFDGAEHLSAYALAYVYSKTEQEVVLLAGSDDGVRLWLNGQLIHHNPAARIVAPDQDRIPAKLRRGWNTVLAKVVNDVGGHGLFLRLSADPGELAEVFAGQRQWDKVLVQLDRLTAAQRGKPDEAALLLRRGRLRARLGRWEGAAKDYTRVLELEPDSHDAWYELAAVRLQLGDRDGYRRHCREMLHRFGRTIDPIEAERTAKACLIVPGTIADGEQLVRLTEQALATAHPQWADAWFLLSRGIAEHRAGRLRQAIDWIEKGRQKIKDAPPVYEALGQLFLSLAYHQLNQAEKARATLGEATRIMDRQLPKADSGDLGDGWLDWVFCQVVRREAQTLIDGPAPGSKKQDAEPSPSGQK